MFFRVFRYALLTIFHSLLNFPSRDPYLTPPIPSLNITCWIQLQASFHIVFGFLVFLSLEMTQRHVIKENRLLLGHFLLGRHKVLMCGKWGILDTLGKFYFKSIQYSVSLVHLMQSFLVKVESFQIFFVFESLGSLIFQGFDFKLDAWHFDFN